MTRNGRPARGVFSRAIRWCLIVAGFLLASGDLVAGDGAGLELARRVQDRPDGRDAVFRVTMALTDAGRRPRVRSMVLYRQDGVQGEVSTLIRFTEPTDIAGTGLLTHDLDDGSSNQWIYLPAMKRVRRVDSNRKGGRFVNSDYYFEDLRDRKASMDKHRIIGRETVAGVECEILESVPVEADNSVYRKRVSWIDPQTLLPLRVDFFERSAEQPNKRLEVTRFELVQGFWTVMDSVMTDLVKRHETRLTVESARYDQDLPGRLFSTQSLEDDRIERRYRP